MNGESAWQLAHTPPQGDLQLIPAPAHLAALAVHK